MYICFHFSTIIWVGCKVPGAFDTQIIYRHLLPSRCTIMSLNHVTVMNSTSTIPATTCLRHLGSLHPIGTKAHATLPTPLSVASRLNCAAAFLVSCTSTLIPIPLMHLLVSGAIGYMPGPNPNINRSGFGHTNPSTPHAPSPVSHCPRSFSSRPRPPASQGRHANASPDTSSRPAPPVILTPLSRWNPSVRQASMEAVGAGALENTSMVLKSVWVGSVEVGPRSVVGGDEEVGGRRWWVVVRVRAWRRSLMGGSGCGECRLGMRKGDEKCLGMWWGFGWKGRVDWIASVAWRARRRGMLGACMVICCLAVSSCLDEL